jgi:hypothetical protein
MNEEELLKKFAKALGAEDTLDKIEQKKIQQEKMLKGMAKLLGTESLLEEIETKKANEQALIEEKREKERMMLEQMNSALSRLVENKPEHAPMIEQEVVAVVSEDLQPMPELPVDDIVTQAVKDLSKTAPKNIQKEVDKLPDGVRKELDILKKSIADLHRFAQRHSQMGGGGAGDVISLDHQTTTILGDHTVGRHDYYIGVGATPVTITLPTNAKNGRMLIIKDEVGNCSTNNITVLGNVDNDSGGFVLAENNGGIQMIFNNGGWRII